MALVDDDDVVGLDRHHRVVGDLDGTIGTHLVPGLLVELGWQRLATQDGVHPLDRGDVDLGDRVELVRPEVLDVVQLGELPAVVGRVVVLELLQGLTAEVGSGSRPEVNRVSTPVLSYPKGSTPSMR